MLKKHIIEVNQLVKRYKKSERNSVDGISFYVEEGSFFSLLGPNGAGKTTTISILTTLLTRTSGSATIAGFDVEKQADQVRQQIGVIFQNPSLDQNLSAEENIRFHANLYNLHPFMPTFQLMDETYKKNVMQLAEVVGLEKDIFKQVKTLSGGMKRKLEIIRSLMHNPRVLFLDEPTTGLDPVSRQNLWKYLQDIRSKKDITIFLTTHYLEEAEGADYVAIIDDGVIVSKGTPTEIKEALIRNYITMDAADRAALRKELHAEKFSFTENGTFTVELGKHTAQQLIQKIKTPLTLLDIHAPSLEDAYVEIITKNHAKS
ncbi:ABC transporter ATP-binding protein [Candidatus Woesebacteria bacterium]|nr:ABC transporter ATP-binding protein [Candidatus Woesebacteria bacterium]